VTWRNGSVLTYLKYIPELLCLLRNKLSINQLNVFLIPDFRGKGYLHFKGIDMKLSNIASTVIATLALVAGAAHAEDPRRRFP
jgi:hypothetical protein